MGVGVDLEDKAGRTALMLAAWRNYSRSARALLALNASVTSRDRHRCSALHFASWRGHEGCVQLLLDAGAEVGVALHAMRCCMLDGGE
jgi:ankyrin repeat protein